MRNVITLALAVFSSTAALANGSGSGLGSVEARGYALCQQQNFAYEVELSGCCEGVRVGLEHENLADAFAGCKALVEGYARSTELFCAVLEGTEKDCGNYKSHLELCTLGAALSVSARVLDAVDQARQAAASKKPRRQDAPRGESFPGEKEQSGQYVDSKGRLH